MRAPLVVSIVTAVVLGAGPSPVMASPTTVTAPVADSGPCKGMGGLLGRWCRDIEKKGEEIKSGAEKVRDHIVHLGKGALLPIGQLLQAARDGIIPYADLVAAGLSSCDPTTWRADPFDIWRDINKCGEAVRPYVSMLAGATFAEKIGLTAVQKVIVQIAEAGGGKPLPIADLIQAARDKQFTLIDTSFRACDPTSWRASGIDLVTDINKCREGVQPYVSMLAGATTEEKMGLIDCVKYPEMAGDIRCYWH